MENDSFTQGWETRIFTLEDEWDDLPDSIFPESFDRAKFWDYFDLGENTLYFNGRVLHPMNGYHGRFEYVDMVFELEKRGPDNYVLTNGTTKNIGYTPYQTICKECWEKHPKFNETKWKSRYEDIVL